MGADLSSTGCAAGPTSLFSLAEWREWRQRRGYNHGLSVSSRYHVNRPLASKYELSDDILGTGMSGPVRLAHGKAGTAIGHRQFAVKTFKKRRGPAMISVKREVMIMLSLDHPNVARVEDVFDLQTEIHLVMERLEGGELFERIVRQGKYAEDVAAEACRAMCRSVAYLHSQNPPIVHRDLKPENFLYARDDSNYLKLIDFGLSTFWDRGVNPRMQEWCGTTAYKAPEIQRQSPYTETCDIFSLGVIAYVLLTGHPPFLSSLEIHKYSPFNQPTFQSISKTGQAFVRSLLETDPGSRPSATWALEHAWLVEGCQPRGAELDEGVLKQMRRFATASQFKRTCLNMLAWSLTAQDREHLESCFTRLDKNDDGRISLNEMRSALEDNFSINSADATELFRKMDDGDDEICYTDFLAVAMQERVRMHEDALWVTFSRFDRGNKGVITADDLRAMLDGDFQGCDADEILAEVDRQGCGQVTCEAFVDFLTSWEDEEPAAPELPVAALLSAGASPATQQKRRASLASRLIDRQRERDEKEAGGKRLWNTFSVSSTRQQAAPNPLQRTGTRLVKSF